MLWGSDPRRQTLRTRSFTAHDGFSFPLLPGLPIWHPIGFLRFVLKNRNSSERMKAFQPYHPLPPPLPHTVVLPVVACARLSEPLFPPQALSPSAREGRFCSDRLDPPPLSPGPPLLPAWLLPRGPSSSESWPACARPSLKPLLSRARAFVCRLFPGQAPSPGQALPSPAQPSPLWPLAWPW